MTIRYLYSGSLQDDSDSTWNSSTISYTTRQAALDAWVVGDEIQVAHDHNEGTASISWSAGTGAATKADRVPFYRVNRSTGVYSPTTGSDTKQYDASTAGADITLSMPAQINGEYFSADDDISVSSQTGPVDFNDCYLELNTYNSVLFLGAASTGGSHCKLANSTVIFTHASGGYIGTVTNLRISNCIFLGYSLPVGLIKQSAARGASLVVEGSDFSGLSSASTSPLIAFGANQFVAVLRNCKFKAGQVLHNSGFTDDGQFLVVENCDDTGNLYENARYSLRGDVTTDTGVYYSGTDGYSDADGTTPLSMKLMPASNVSLASPLVSLDMIARIDTTGAKTFTVECVENFTTALTKREAWIEVEYLGSASETLFSMADDREFVASSYTNLAAGSGLGDWTAEPAGSRTVKLTASATVNQAGLYRVRLFLAKYEAAKVLHYNPAVTVT